MSRDLKLFFSILGLVLTVFALITIFSGVVDLSNLLGKYDEVKCEVEVGVAFGDPVLSDLSRSCVRTGKECSPLFTKAISPFSLFKAEGNLILEGNNDIVEQSIDVSRLEITTTVTEKLCTGGENILAKILDNQGNLVQTRTINIG